MNAKAKKIIKRTLKVLLWTVVTLVVLVALVLWAVVWAISPENLTKYAEQAANEYLDAKVEIGRLELTAYSTFPILHVDIDSLKVTSGSLEAVSDVDTSSLPADASHLVSLSRLHFSVNLAEAMIGRIDIAGQGDVWVSVNPNHCHIALVPFQKIGERNNACGTFAAKRHNLVGLLNIKNAQSRFGLCDNSFLVHHAIGHFPFHNVRRNRNGIGSLPVVRGEEIKQLSSEIISS